MSPNKCARGCARERYSCGPNREAPQTRASDEGRINMKELSLSDGKQGSDVTRATLDSVGLRKRSQSQEAEVVCFHLCEQPEQGNPSGQVWFPVLGAGGWGETGSDRPWGQCFFLR